MPLRPKPDAGLLLLGLLLIVAGGLAIDFSRKTGDAHARFLIEQEARIAAEQEAEQRRLQLDGALEKITELKGDDEPTAGE